MNAKTFNTLRLGSVISRGDSTATVDGVATNCDGDTVLTFRDADNGEEFNLTASSSILRIYRLLAR